MTDLTVQQQDELTQYISCMSGQPYDKEILESIESSFIKRIENTGSDAMKEPKKVLAREKLKFIQSVLKLKTQQPSQEITEEYIARKFISILNSAERRGKEFNLTLKEVKKLLNRKTCYYTGVKLVNPLKDHEDNPVDNARTFDRIDNEQGYVLGNVVACSHWSNQLKNTLFEAPEGLALGKEKLVKKLLEKML